MMGLVWRSRTFILWENKEKIKSRKLNQLTVYHVILGGKMWLIADASQKKTRFEQKRKRVNNFDYIRNNRANENAWN